MVFSSIPVYLDPPNWQQQPNHQFVSGNGQEQLLGQLPPLPPPIPQTGGSTRPGSLADRARVAKVPPPEPGLKCPRCESTNTKFCYYNNYSLTQPRHFCKTCRRYWTRGGALRNVPVGGGCRRNKRSKSSRNGSKSPATTMAVSGSITTTPGGGGGEGGVIPPDPMAPPLPFLAPSSDYGDMEFQIGTSNNYGELGQSAVNGSSGLLLGEQWRVQQFPNFLANFGASSPSCGLFHFEGGEVPMNGSQLGLNLSRHHHHHHLVNLPGNNYDHHHQFSWSHDVSGFTSSNISTTTHHL